MRHPTTHDLPNRYSSDSLQTNHGMGSRRGRRRTVKADGPAAAPSSPAPAPALPVRYPAPRPTHPPSERPTLLIPSNRSEGRAIQSPIVTQPSTQRTYQAVGGWFNSIGKAGCKDANREKCSGTSRYQVLCTWLVPACLSRSPSRMDKLPMCFARLSSTTVRLTVHAAGSATKKSSSCVSGQSLVGTFWLDQGERKGSHDACADITSQ